MKKEYISPAMQTVVLAAEDVITLSCGKSGDAVEIDFEDFGF